jgi:hypothetical protein
MSYLDSKEGGQLQLSLSFNQQSAMSFDPQSLEVDPI